MTDTKDMLPCPHCGSENIDESAARGYEGREGEEKRGIISAGCLDCGATGPDCYVPENSTGYEVAAKAWNNRQSQQAQGEAAAWIVQTPSGYKKKPRAILRSQHNVESPDFWFGGKPPKDAIITPLYTAQPAPAAVPDYASMADQISGMKVTDDGVEGRGYNKALDDVLALVSLYSSSPTPSDPDSERGV